MPAYKILLIIIGIAAHFFILNQSCIASQQNHDDIKNLVKAIDFYYNQEYSEALSLFNQMNSYQNNPDILYWSAKSASKTKNYPLAITKLKQLLKINDDISIKIELAHNYKLWGKISEAQKEMDKIDHQQLSENDKQKYNRFKKEIEKELKKIKWYIWINQGIQYDDNISGGPDDSVIRDALAPLYLDKQYIQKSGYNFLTDFTFFYHHDMGSPGGFFWRTNARGFSSINSENKDYNYLKADYFSGPVFSGNHFLLKFPCGITYKQYSNNPLSVSYMINPGFELVYSKHLDFDFSIKYQKENYEQENYSDSGYDSHSIFISLGFNLTFDAQTHNISGKIIFDNHTAEEYLQTYQGVNFSLNYLYRFSPKWDFFLFYHRMDKEYVQNYPYYHENRLDYRNTLAATISHNFLTDFFVSFQFAYIHNHSNANLYTYDRKTVTLSTGMKY
jgi:phenolic acid decarboxylase